MTPLPPEEDEPRKLYRISLRPSIYERFKLFCDARGWGRHNEIIEDLISATMKNEAFIALTWQILGKNRSRQELEEKKRQHQKYQRRKLRRMGDEDQGI